MGKGKKGKGKGKGKQEEKEWVPVTKLGRLVKDQKITSLEDIYLHSLPIKEYQIIDQFFQPGTLKDEVMKIHPVQKMTSAGQRNRIGHPHTVPMKVNGKCGSVRIRLIPAPRGSE